MAIGFVFIRTAPSLEIDLFRELEACGAFRAVSLVFGDFDIIAKVEAPDEEALNAVVLDVVRTRPGIEETRTILTSATEEMPAYYKRR